MIGVWQLIGVSFMVPGWPLVINLVFSWVLGILLEHLFFNKNNDRSFESVSLISSPARAILLGKVGYAILFTLGIIVIKTLIQLMEKRVVRDEDILNLMSLSPGFGLVLAIALLCLYVYRRDVKSA